MLPAKITLDIQYTRIFNDEKINIHNRAALSELETGRENLCKGECFPAKNTGIVRHVGNTIMQQISFLAP